MLPAIVSAAAQGQDAGGASFLLPPLYEVFWAAVVLLLILLVVGRYALPRVYRTLDERAERIQQGLDLTAKAQEDQAGAEQRAARIVEEARREAASIRESAHSEAAAIIQAARQEAQGEAGKAMAAADQQIRAEQQAARTALRNDVGLLASDLAAKIVGEQLSDTELSRRVIDRFLDDLEADPAVLTGSDPLGRVVR